MKSNRVHTQTIIEETDNKKKNNLFRPKSPTVPSERTFNIADNNTLLRDEILEHIGQNFKRNNCLKKKRIFIKWHANLKKKNFQLFFSIRI